MDLKFTFGGGTPAAEHTHGAESPGIPLPFAGATQQPTSASSVLELRVSIGADDEGAGAVRCEAVSGDGATYGKAEKAVHGEASPALLAAAARSVIARAGAELPEPLLGSVSSLTLSFGGAEAAVLQELGLLVEPSLDPQAPVSAVDAALQARTGILAGTPIRVAR